MLVCQIFIGVLSLLTTAVAASSPGVQQDARIVVGVVVRAYPSEDVWVLEIGDRAFALSREGETSMNGVAEVDGRASSYPVRVLTDSCRVLVEFRAVAGTMHQIQINGNAVQVEQVQVMDAGPSLRERFPTGCAANPVGTASPTGEASPTAHASPRPDESLTASPAADVSPPHDPSRPPDASPTADAFPTWIVVGGLAVVGVLALVVLAFVRRTSPKR